MKHTISVLVENKFGVLAHVAGLFSARGFNITSLSVGETEDPSVSRMTIVVDADDKTLEQVKKQLNKLIDIIKIADLTGSDFIDRELVLIKISADAKTRSRVIESVDSVEGASVADVGSSTITVEVTGDQSRINTLIELLRPFGIKEMARTGQMALAREVKTENKKL